MKEVVMYAKYNQAGNKTIYDILSALSNDEREMDRGSFCGSLSGLLCHNVEVTLYFFDLFKETLKNNENAFKVISSLESISFSKEGQLNEAGWKDLGAALDTVDTAYISLAEALTDADISLLVEIEWYDGNPASVPLSFLLSQLLVHNTHHRGQISHILDSLKIDNDYSGIGLEFLSG